jgi:hypothetical protein
MALTGRRPAEIFFSASFSLPLKKTPLSRAPLRRPTQNPAGSRYQLRALPHPSPGRPEETYPGPCDSEYSLKDERDGQQPAERRTFPLPRWSMVPVGNVTISPNAEMPQDGDIVEVRYLYAYENGSVYQTIYLGNGDDIIPQACTVGQLKFKKD